MTCQGVPPCCDQCCTHRLFDPEIDWSESVSNKQICGAGLDAAPTVVDSWRNGDYVYFVAEIPRLVDGVVRFGYRAEKWSKTGTRQWKTAILFTTTDTGFTDQDRTECAKIASDGTNVWVAIAENAGTGGLSKMWRLNASTGATSYAGAAGCGDSLLSGLKVRSLCPDGAGKVLVGHQGDIGGEDFINTWDDDTCTDYFGVPGSADTTYTTTYCTSIVVDGANVYAGHTSCYCSTFADGYEGTCGPPGFVTRFNSDRDVVWISYKAAVEKAWIAKSGGTIFYGLNGQFSDSEYGAMDDEWGEPDWERQLDNDPMVDVACGTTITDLDCDGSHIWISACRWVFQLDHLGIIESATPHVHETDIPDYSVDSPVKTVAAISDGTAVGSGEAMLCDPETALDPEERDSSATTCGTLTPGCTGMAQTSPAWCNVNACGTLSTNGRFAISECTDPDQWPLCTGPGVITYVDCDDVETTETFNFTSACSSGGRTWTGTFDGGSVEIEYVCGDTFGPENVTVSIDDCTVTVDSASITCDGPLGYAKIDFTFSGTCGECAINGCGAFGAESCEVPSPCGGCDSPPTTAFATVTSSCGAVNGATGSGDRDGDQYEATLSACGLTATLICQESGFNISMSPAECFLTPLTAATGACDPFSWSASFLYINGGSCTCCDTGSITVTFTE